MCTHNHASLYTYIWYEQVMQKGTTALQISATFVNISPVVAYNAVHGLTSFSSKCVGCRGQLIVDSVWG